MVPPQKPTQATSFDQLIDEIDRDIQYVEGMTTEQRSLKESNPDQTISQPNGPNIPNEAPPADKSVDNIKASPLTDISNNSQAHADFDSVSGRKWTRFQRPNFLSTDEQLDYSLGKRGPLPNSVDSTPQKRKATSKDDTPSSPSQRRWLVGSPAEQNESPLLERAWAWEPMHRSRARMFCSGTRSLRPLLS